LVAVTITAAPSAPTAAAQQFVASGATVANLAAAGTAIKWYATPTSTSALAATTPLTTGTTYYASQTSATCESSRTAVVVALASSARALSFGGGDDRVRVADNNLLTPANAITIEFWTRRNSSTATYNMLVRKTTPSNWTAGYSVYWVSNDIIEFAPTGYYIGRVTPSNQIPLNTWTHVAATYDGANASIYYNGVLQATKPITGAMTDTAFDLFIGSDNTNSYTAFCDIDMVRLWSTARTQTEIASNLNSCISSGTAGLIAQYDFEEAAGSTAFQDTSGNNLHGTYNNMEVADWIAGATCGQGQGFLSVANNEFTANLKVYPNPSNNIFNVAIDSDAKIEIIDMLGKQIMGKRIQSGNSQLDLSNFASGIYLMKITNELNQTKTIKLIKQ
jgi:hypothetical protein